MGNLNMLPDEIMLEIFSGIPTESVLECKLVSKPWRNLLQDQFFSHMHLNHQSAHNSAKLSCILYTIGSAERQIYYAEYDETLNRFNRITRMKIRYPFQTDWYLLGSCNGLLCFHACVDNLYFQPVYICNPLTREYVVFPKIEQKCFLSGFGYTPSTNEYKVVRICKDKGDSTYGIIQVYTLGSGIGWRNGRKMDYDVMSFRPFGVFANGAIHWVDSRGTIVAFDLAYEEFRELPSPPWLSPVSVYLHGLGDFLCASDSPFSGDCDIWILKKNISNHEMIWTKEYSNISVTPIDDTNVYLCASKSLSSGMLVSWYNYCDKNFNLRMNFAKHSNVGVPHKNTLVSLKSLGEDNTKLMDQVKEQDRTGRQKAMIIVQRQKWKKMISRLK